MKIWVEQGLDLLLTQLIKLLTNNISWVFINSINRAERSVVISRHASLIYFHLTDVYYNVFYNVWFCAAIGNVQWTTQLITPNFC